MPSILKSTLADIRAMDGPELIAQQIMQHGVICALEHLIEIGPTREHVASMLANLRTAIAVTERVATAKGVALVVDRD